MNKLQQISKYFKNQSLRLCEGCGCGGGSQPTPSPTSGYFDVSHRSNPQIELNQLNDPNFIAQIVTQVVQQMQNQGGIQEQMLGEQGTTIGKGTSNPFPNRAEREKENSSQMVNMTVDLKMDSDVGEPVTVEYDPKKNLRDVTISWGNESHTVDFEAGDEIDNYDNEGSDIETMANSDDGRWQFILDVYVGYQFKNTGDYEEWDFNELIVQHHPENEDHLDPEDRSDYDNGDELGSAMAKTS